MTLQKKANHAMGKNLLLNQIGKFKFEEKTFFYKIGHIFVITCPAYYMNR